jgi:hypothetical protein
MDAKFKSCPFCGHESPVVMHTEDGSVYWVRCGGKKCQAEGPEVDIDEFYYIDQEEDTWSFKIVKERTIAAAIARWNYRIKVKQTSQKIKHKIQPDERC